MAEPIHNVPQRASSFVGRADVLEDLAARFERGARLLTILAPGGMGKTRVAQRFAAGSASRWSTHGAGGVGFCDLTGARTAADVAAVVGETFGLPADVDDLGRALARRRRVLVVLDNCEHLVGALRELISAWILRAPNAQLLATSRELLGVDGEELVPLGPLPARREGVDLFVERARARAPSFDPSAADRERISRIVERLDGFPLAIELAAARVLVLSLADIEQRLDAPLELLVRAGASGKHDSMRRAIASSVAQLGDRERTFFAALAVFRAPFTLRAAERVLGGLLESSVLDAVELLVGRSLLNATVTPEGTRFGFYEAIREFAAEELAERRGVVEDVAARHAVFFASDDAPAMEADAADLLAAHAWAVGAAPSSAATIAGVSVRLASALPRHAARRRDALDASLAAISERGGALEPTAHAELLAARGRASREVGRLEDAARDFERSLELADTPSVALRLAEVVETQGDTARALAIATRAHAAAETLDGPGARRPQRDAIVADALARIGHVHRREGRIADAQRETERAVSLQRVLGPSEGLAFALYEAAVLALFRGHFDASMAAFDEGLAVVAEGLARDPHGTRLLLANGALTTGRGTLLQERGRAGDAIALHAEAARIFADLGDLHREGSALYYWAGAYMETGALADAETILSRALSIVEGIGVPRYEALIAGALAVVVAHRDVGRSRVLLEKADAAAERCAREGALVATLAIHRLHVDALDGRTADPLREAEALAARFECDDPRFALRVLTSRVRGASPAAGPLLRVGQDGAWFEPPGDDRRVDLTKRAPLRRILALLAARRVASPGDRVDLEEIVDAGWPGEKMKIEAAANRVYVALATLRKLGLRSALSSGLGGYFIDPAVAVTLID